MLIALKQRTGLIPLHMRYRSKVPEDPIFQLVFPQPEMLSRNDFNAVRDVMASPKTTRVAVREEAERIRSTLNAHPAEQREKNIPIMGGQRMKGMQHKYRNTLLFFPVEVGLFWSPIKGAIPSYIIDRANTVTLTARIAFDGLNSPRLDQINK